MKVKMKEGKVYLTHFSIVIKGRMEAVKMRTWNSLNVTRKTISDIFPLFFRWLETMRLLRKSTLRCVNKELKVWFNFTTRFENVDIDGWTSDWDVNQISFRTPADLQQAEPLKVVFAAWAFHVIATGGLLDDNATLRTRHCLFLTDELADLSSC